jgi:hypothetical protein
LRPHKRLGHFLHFNRVVLELGTPENVSLPIDIDSPFLRRRFGDDKIGHNCPILSASLFPFQRSLGRPSLVSERWVSVNHFEMIESSGEKTWYQSLRSRSGQDRPPVPADMQPTTPFIPSLHHFSISAISLAHRWAPSIRPTSGSTGSRHKHFLFHRSSASLLESLHLTVHQYR